MLKKMGKKIFTIGEIFCLNLWVYHDKQCIQCAYWVEFCIFLHPWQFCLQEFSYFSEAGPVAG